MNNRDHFVYSGVLNSLLQLVNTPNKSFRRSLWHAVKAICTSNGMKG